MTAPLPHGLNGAIIFGTAEDFRRAMNWPVRDAFTKLYEKAHVENKWRTEVANLAAYRKELAEKLEARAQECRDYREQS